MSNSLGWDVLFDFCQDRFPQLSAHFRLDKARSDTVTGNFSLGQFFGQRTRHPDQARFRGRVVGLAGVTDQT